MPLIFSPHGNAHAGGGHAEDFDPRRILYLDTETRASRARGRWRSWWRGELRTKGFTVRQYLIAGLSGGKVPAGEGGLGAGGADVICTFNGELRMCRCLGRVPDDRMSPACLDKPHIDFCTWPGGCGSCGCSGAILGGWRRRCWGRAARRFPGGEGAHGTSATQDGQFDLLREVIKHNARTSPACVCCSATWPGSMSTGAGGSSGRMFFDGVALEADEASRGGAPAAYRWPRGR